MSIGLKKRKKTRRPRLEQLEKRELLAANPVVQLEGSTLKIRGTSGNDEVTVTKTTEGQLRGFGPRGNVVYEVTTGFIGGGVRRAYKFPAASVANIDAVMGDGSDRFRLKSLHGRNSLNQVNVDLGFTNRREPNIVDVRNTDAAILQITGKSSGTKTTVQINNSSISRTLNLKLGKSKGSDNVTLLRSNVNRLICKTGKGNDRLTINRSHVGNLKGNLGAGNDRFISANRSTVGSGNLKGGAGWDRIDGSSLKSTNIRFFDFEAVRNRR